MKNYKQVLKEHLATKLPKNQIVTEDIQLLEEFDFLTEDLKSFARKMSIDKAKSILKRLKPPLEKVDIKAVKSVFSPIPKMDPTKGFLIAKKLVPNFDSSYKIARTHLKKKYSNLSDSMTKNLATVVATATGGVPNSENMTKKCLSFIDKYVEKNSKKKVTIEQETLGEAGVIFFLVLFGLISFVVGVGTLLFGGILWGLRYNGGLSK